MTSRRGGATGSRPLAAGSARPRHEPEYGPRIELARDRLEVQLEPPARGPLGCAVDVAADCVSVLAVRCAYTRGAVALDKRE